MSYRIVLADDHEIFRLGVKTIINDTKNLKVVGEANDGLELLKLLKNSSAQMVIIDISMPNLRGIETAREVKKINSSIKVLILTMHKNKEYLYHCLSAGAEGYLLKEDAGKEIFSAIETIRQGNTYISPHFTKEVAEDLAKIYSDRLQPPFERLTNREREVLTLIAEGKSRKEIAELLFISVHTVGHHRANIVKKLKIKTTAKLVRYAVQKGFTSTTEPDNVL